MMFLKPSDLVAISQTSLVITAILARVFLKEQLCLGHFVAIALAVLGVLLISKPTFLFRSEPSSQVTSKFLNHSNTTASNSSEPFAQETADSSLKNALGIGLTFLGAIAASCVFLVLKKLSISRVHWASNTIFVCWFGLPLSTVISLVLIRLGYAHTSLADERNDLPMDVFYSVLSSMLSLIGQVLLNIALRYEDATRIAITRTTDVLFSCLLQYFLLDILIDLVRNVFSILPG